MNAERSDPLALPAIRPANAEAGPEVELLDDLVPALDVGASVALVSTPDALATWLKESGDAKRFEVAVEILEEFDGIEAATGWSRPVMASLIGCHHPDPEAWLNVDIGELMHSRTVVGFIREVTDLATESDLAKRVASLRDLAPSASDADIVLVARREVGRSAVRLCRELLRRGRGSTFAVRRVLDDGAVLRLIADDSPGDALLIGYERLAPRSRVTALIESKLGTMVLREQDAEQAGVTTVEEIQAEIRSGLHLSE